MKNLLIAVLSIALLGCTTPIKDKTYVPPIPAKVESAVPTQKKVADKIDSIGKSNEKIDKSVAIQSQAVLDQKIALKEAMANAERIKEQAKAKQIVSEIDAAKMMTSLTAIQEKNFFLEKNVEELQKEITFQKSEVWFARRDAGVLLTKLTAKEGEADALRDLTVDLGTKLGDRDKDVAQLKKESAAKDAKIARNGVYRNWIIGGVSLLILGFLAKLALKRYGIL